MARIISKVFIVWLSLLGTVESTVWGTSHTPPVPLLTEETEADEEELVAERHREEKPNLYDYNQQELRNEAERNARRAQWSRPLMPPRENPDYNYQYHESHSAYEQ